MTKLLTTLWGYGWLRNKSERGRKSETRQKEWIKTIYQT